MKPALLPASDTTSLPLRKRLFFFELTRKISSTVELAVTVSCGLLKENVNGASTCADLALTVLSSAAECTDKRREEEPFKSFVLIKRSVN